MHEDSLSFDSLVRHAVFLLMPKMPGRNAQAFISIACFKRNELFEQSSCKFSEFSYQYLDIHTCP